MLTFTSGDLLSAPVEALVNTVNTVGIMGKGLALQFRHAFPQNYASYVKACKTGHVKPGHMFVTEPGHGDQKQYIINFPTKRHWRDKSRIIDIESGLTDLTQVIRGKRIKSIAVPPLGCGNGGLEWDDVCPRIVQALEIFREVTVLIYEPRLDDASQ